MVYKQILIPAKLQIGKRAKKRADWEKSIQEAKVRTYCSASEEEEEEEEEEGEEEEEEEEEEGEIEEEEIKVCFLL